MYCLRLCKTLSAYRLMKQIGTRSDMNMDALCCLDECLGSSFCLWPPCKNMCVLVHGTALCRFQSVSSFLDCFFRMRSGLRLFWMVFFRNDKMTTVLLTASCFATLWGRVPVYVIKKFLNNFFRSFMWINSSMKMISTVPYLYADISEAIVTPLSIGLAVKIGSITKYS